MKILVTGVKGQLGFDVVKECNKRGIETVGVDIEEMDITNAQIVSEVITNSNVDAVIHCAAYTAVDKAEDNKELCHKINVEGTKNIAQVCQKLNLKMMYFSTDYTFNGAGTKPWLTSDKPDPINYYGLTKYEGELEVIKYVKNYFILRISWVFGINGKNFINTMLRLGKENGKVRVVSDQIGSPTYTIDLARLIVDMIQTDKYGIYHTPNTGYVSWYEFAKEIFKQANMQVEVTPITTESYPSRAKRPLNSRLDQSTLISNGFTPLPTWQDALSRYLKQKIYG